MNQFQRVKIPLNKNELPQIKIIHRRRNIEIGKEIYPGRNIDEFAISVLKSIYMHCHTYIRGNMKRTLCV